jgi:ASPM-SPD-2-Hydin domain-containing protein/centrosomal CEP192-like protein
MRTVGRSTKAPAPSKRNPAGLAAAALVALAMVGTTLVTAGNSASATGGPDVALSTTGLTFAPQPVGTRTDALSVQLTNDGDSPLTISTFRITGDNADDFHQSIACPVGPDTLAAGGSCTVYVSFTSTVAGAESAVLAIGDDAVSSPQNISLSGTGVATPNVQLSPGSLSFGAIQVGARSAAQTVTLANRGTAPLALSSISISGQNAAEFSRTATTCAIGGEVQAGMSCTVDVTFAPQSGGDKQATLSFGDNAGDAPESVSLTGTGTATPAPSVSLSPSGVVFGSQMVGTSSAAQTVTLTNTGGAALSLAGIGVAGADPGDFAQTNTCPVSLAAGSSCTVSVTFSPAAPGARSGSLTVADNAGDSPQTVALSGAAAAAGTYLADDFESGSLGQWSSLVSSDATIALDATNANSGAGSVRFTNNSAGQYARLSADLAGGGHSQTYTRFCFRLGAGFSEGTEIANGRAITSVYPDGIRRWEITYNPVTKGLEAYFWNEDLQRLDMYAATGQVQTDTWYCAELYLDEQTNGTAKLWLNGVSVGTVTGDLSAPNPYSRLFLWDQPGAGSDWFDDVAVADSPIGTIG